LHHELESRDRDPWVGWQDILLTSLDTLPM